MDILVIGPEPQCIRCKTALRRAEEASSKYDGLAVIKVGTQTPEGQKYGRAESGHIIAKNENVDEDHLRIESLRAEISELEKNEEQNRNKIRDLIAALDKELTPVKTTAAERGYLMTPVIVVNEVVKSTGNVPTTAQIVDWIEEELN